MGHQIKKQLLAGAIITAILCLALDAETVHCDTFSKLKNTLVLDPGHGGHDTGVKGPDGSFEKDITLIIAKKIKQSLKDKYNVVLTRTDDYWTDIHTRTETANQSGASLFISIHTSGSYVHETAGINILHFSPQAASNTPPADTGSMPGIIPEIATKAEWLKTQTKYSSVSRAFGEAIAAKLSHSPRYPHPRVSGLPALVLSGANMPAVIIEVGHLTNPSEEKLLSNPEYLYDFTNELCKGIDEFFRKHPKTD